MKPSRQSARVVLTLATLISIALLGGIAYAGETYRIIHDFQGSYGWFPASVAAATNGDLYGVTVDGGAYGWGTVFKLTAPRTRDGAWTKTVLYTFPGGKGGGYPVSLVIGHDGNLYGVDFSQTIFELKPPTSHSAPWNYTALYTLNQKNDGAAIQGIVLDSEGNLFGATELGGDLACEQEGCGTVFELKTPTKEGGKWRFSVLYTFTGRPNGAEPFDGVVFDQKGNLDGTTFRGGTDDWGAVYRLSPPEKKDRGWTETVLYSFNPNNDGIISPGDR